MADQAKFDLFHEAWNGNSRFKRHHIERKEVRRFDAICACHFAVKCLKYTIKFLRSEREDGKSGLKGDRLTGDDDRDQVALN